MRPAAAASASPAFASPACALLACVLLACALPAGPAAASPPPPHAELKAQWEGGTWSQDIGRAGTFLSGYKDGAGQFEMPDFVPPNPLPLKPEPKAVEQKIRRAMAQGHQIFGPYGACHPSGMPYILTMSGYGGYEAKVADDELIFFYGNQREARRIRFSPAKAAGVSRDPLPYNGVSLAHWEGRTMVVKTTSIRADNTQYEPYVPKAPGTEVEERYTPVSQNRIDIVVTVTSPDFFRPWVIRLKLTRDPQGKLVEGLCTDDNRWVYHNGELVLTDPDGKPLEKADAP